MYTLVMADIRWLFRVTAQIVVMSPLASYTHTSPFEMSSRASILARSMVRGKKI